MTRLLFATHGGQGADGAARVAALLAARRQAHLDVLSVLEPLPVLESVNMGIPGTALASSAEEFERLAERLNQDVTAQLQRCRVAGATTTVKIGPAAAEIAAVARTSAADLIVIGLGAHDFIDRALGGETALQLVQLATTPVLAVPRDATRLPKRAVAAIDFTPTSVRAARSAAQCLASGDVLDLVHVALEGLPSREESRLRDLASQLAVPPGVEVVAIELHGDPARTLLGYLDTSEAEMIALGSHGYGLWKRLALGSVVSKVVRLARCAVLVAPLGSIAVPG